MSNTIIDAIEAEFESLATEVKQGFAVLYSDFNLDVLPFLKAAFITLLTVEGKAALAAEAAVAPIELADAAVGNFTGAIATGAAAVASAITSTIGANVDAAIKTVTAESTAAIEAQVAAPAVEAPVEAPVETPIA